MFTNDLKIAEYSLPSQKQKNEAFFVTSFSGRRTVICTKLLTWAMPAGSAGKNLRRREEIREIFFVAFFCYIRKRNWILAEKKTFQTTHGVWRPKLILLSNLASSLSSHFLKRSMFSLPLSSSVVEKRRKIIFLSKSQGLSWEWERVFLRNWGQIAPWMRVRWTRRQELQLKALQFFRGLISGTQNNYTP